MRENLRKFSRVSYSAHACCALESGISEVPPQFDPDAAAARIVP
jgi:hypothetical protein